MTSQKKVLVTGGLGYIGSHTVLKLLDENYKVVIIDDLSNSFRYVHDRLEAISNKKIDFYELDISDDQIESVFEIHDFFAVIHFAAFKSISMSIDDPLNFYSNNIAGSLNILRHVQKFNIKNFVFSSSATVYDEKNKMPLNENSSYSF